MTRKPLLWLAYGALLAVVTLAGIEALAWAITPAWPGYLLRPAPISRDALARWHAGMPEVPFVTNSWLMRDRERSIDRPPGVAFRTIFVGDSFLEGGFTRAALASRVEGRLIEARHEDVEAINLGVAGTGPVEYYHRLREVGLALAPDAVVLAFYSGNDVIAERFSDRASPPFIAELPRPSLLGGIAPHLTWQAINALRLSGAARGGVHAPNEQDIIADALRRPAAEGLPLLVQLMHRFYFPALSQAQIHEILARGGERFWSEFRPRRFDREYLQGWILAGLISLEAGTHDVPTTDVAANAAVPFDEVEATMSWLLATERLVRSHGKTFLLAAIPVGSVDPDFVAFWQPWPRFYSYTRRYAALHKAMVAALSRSGLRLVDLEADLDGVPGTYRKTDLHWTERGHEVVAERLSKEIIALRK